jgi:Leucine-rich repeat (LRR) protein
MEKKNKTNIDNYKYIVYRNDIKYKTRNDIDLNRAIFENKDVEKDFLDSETDGVDYRMRECAREKYQIIDVTHTDDAEILTKILSHNQIDKIKDKVIIISANEILYKNTNANINITIPNLSKTFRNLQSINISSNGLKEIPELPEGIEELIVDDNLIEKIPSFRNIKRISAKNNRLKDVGYSESIESLIIPGNSTLFTLGVKNLPNLYYLDISKSGIVEIPKCSNLKYLDISDTKIRKLPLLKKISILRCERSELEDISNIDSLYVLMISDSKIRTIHYMENLQKLIYSELDNTQVKLSNRYKIYNICKNKNNIYDIVLKPQLLPVKILKD